MRIVVLGGGFGGVTAVRHLERVLRRHAGVEITLVSRENSRHARAGWSCGIVRSPSAPHFNTLVSLKPPSNRLTWNVSSFEPLLLMAVRTVCRTAIW